MRQILYLFKTECMDREKLRKDPNVQTSLRWLASDTKMGVTRLALMTLRSLRLMKPDGSYLSLSPFFFFFFITIPILTLSISPSSLFLGPSAEKFNAQSLKSLLTLVALQLLYTVLTVAVSVVCYGSKFIHSTIMLSIFLKV